MSSLTKEKVSRSSPKEKLPRKTRLEEEWEQMVMMLWEKQAFCFSSDLYLTS